MPSRSLPRVAIALGFSDPEKLLEHARREVEHGESFLELRLDYLADPAQGLAVIRRLRGDYPDCLVLATCRRRQNRGYFNGSLEEQMRLLMAAVEAGARAVDIEIESAEACPDALAAFRGKAELVLSYHNYECTPALEPILRRLMRVPADLYKIATTARKPSDNCRVLALIRENSRTPLVVLAMGQIGLPSRVLGPAFGARYTYAAPLGAEGTAPGQVCGRQLRSLYRIEKLSRRTKIYGVIADPVSHSISPAVHNRAFQTRRLDAVYLPFQVPTGQLRDFMTLATDLPVAGFSVTIPHKQKILRYLDWVDPLAKRIGAVNTVWRRAARWRGANTDVEGVRVPLERRTRLAGASVLLVGNGGAARAAAFTLVDAGARLSIVGRSPDRVRALARLCGAEPVLREQLGDRHFDILVHATPLGMYPNVNDCFFPDRIPADIVFDMVYNPVDTVLLRRAREQGKEVISGLEMFNEQAARQFEIWTGEPAPRAAMERAAREALGAGDPPIMTK
jgi:3-dehydroquinate dehydratase/shikimate dehydrogenase